MSFIATLTDKNRTDFKFPYGKFPGIKESHHRIRVGVSYGKSDPSTQVIDFYDSRCRTCDDKTGVSEEPVSHTKILRLVLKWTVLIESFVF